MSNSIVHIEFVRLGLANSILPYFAVADHLTRSSLAATRIKDLSLSQTLVWRSDRPQNALVAEVAEAIRTIMSGLPEDDYRVLNTEATIGLARAAQRAGAKRFVFLSSIRAQSGASADRVLTEDVAPQPTEAYGRSKLAAERGLAELALDWVALRLVLVYGPGVKGNMASFRAGNFDFIALTTHIRWGKTEKKRTTELAMLADYVVARTVKEMSIDSDIIVMGDFNIPSLDSPLYKAVVKRGLTMPASLAGITGSNLAKNKRYDQILHNPVYTKSITNKGGCLDFIGDGWGALYPEAKSKFDQDFTYQLSDHLPLWIMIRSPAEGDGTIHSNAPPDHRLAGCWMR